MTSIILWLYEALRFKKRDSIPAVGLFDTLVLYIYQRFYVSSKSALLKMKLYSGNKLDMHAQASYGSSTKVTSAQLYVFSYADF